MGFIDQLQAEGHAVESIIRVLREQVVRVAARICRAWRQGRVAARTVTDAVVADAVRDAAWVSVTMPERHAAKAVGSGGLVRGGGRRPR